MFVTYLYIVVLALAMSSLVVAEDPDSASSPASQAPSPVSWQSAFLGLVPLALNAMTQPSSLDHPISQSSLLFPSRSSPFICLADALEVLLSLVIHLYHGHAPRQAALLVNWQRARCRLGQDIDSLEDSPAEKHPIALGILFVGSMLQAGKIFGFEGLVWTKVWAGAYLGSFVVLAIAGLLAPRDWRENPPDIPHVRSATWRFENLSKVLLYTSLLAHFICCSWILDRIFDRAVGDWFVFATDATTVILPTLIIIIASSLLFFAPFALLYLFWLMVQRFVGSAITSHFRRDSLGVARVAVNVCMFIFGMSWLMFSLIYISIRLGFVLGRLLGTESPEPTIIRRLNRGGSNLLFYIFIVWRVKIFLENYKWPLVQKLNILLKSHGSLVLFACWNFLEALLYYRFRYDPHDTVKPSWTDNLG